jgi:hypothetical protein
MKLVRMKTLGLFGLGFLAGSRAGRGPWEKAQAGMDQIKGKVGAGPGGCEPGGSMTSNGLEGGRGQTTPQVTEI